LAQAALEQLPIDRLLVLVAAAPGHREVVAPAEERLQLARLAFDFADEVVLDDHAYTVDAVRDDRFGDAIFVVGADEGAAFPTWRKPDEILRHVRLAVGDLDGVTDEHPLVGEAAAGDAKAFGLSEGSDVDLRTAQTVLRD